FGTNTDVTEQRLAEEQVSRQAQELRALNERLRELDRAKTAFFSNISHEFRTPLTLMLGPVEDILAKRPEEVLSNNRELLTVVHRNGLRLQKLVNTLLDFARIEAGRVEAVYEETDLAVFTGELASVFRAAIERAGLKLIIECSPLPEPVHVDRQMWEKIVFNLLSNAFKFTFEGEIEVALRWRRERVELSVRDTGVGIASDELPRIFERFHRVPNVRSRTYEGTGIGLALVQELARLHGGEATVQSTFGRGSTFTVTIKPGTAHLPKERIGAARTMVSTAVGASPFVEEAMQWLTDEENTESGKRKDEGESGERDEGGRMKDEFPSEDSIRQSKTCGEPCQTIQNPKSKILVADDNADMREYARRLLLQQGYDVIAVPDGEAALAVAREQKPDLVVADVMMPRLDGFGLLRALRNDPTTSTLPIILLSARAGEESRVEGFERGADDYLVKPFSARELLARVGAQLTMSQLRTAALQRERVLRIEAEKLNEVARSLTAELDLQALVQKVTDAGTELTAGKFGAFFYNSVNEQDESYLLYTLSGAPREAFEKFGIPRNTPLFEPTFQGAGVVRIEDVLKDPRYGHNPLHHGMPQGHLVVRSYLAVPVISRFGKVLGGLFFGHPEPAVFTEHAERIALGIAAQAGIAIDNAELHQQAKKEIEERARVETALRQREEHLRILAEALPAMVWSCRPDGSLIYLNRRWSDYTGQTLEESQGYGWARTMHPEDQPRILAQWEQCTRKGEVYEGEVRYRHRGGEYRWHYFRGVPLRDKDGRITAWYGTSIDIHDRKVAEAALRESEERFRTVADNIAQLAWTCDKLGNVTWYNQRWLDYTGMTFEEMKDWGWTQCHHPDHVDRVVASVQHSRDSGQPWDDTFPLRGKDGNYRWFLSRAIPIRDATGKIVRWFGTNTDVTEQREAEERLHKLTEDLEKRVNERTKELQQANAALLRDMEERKKLEEQLLQAQKMESIGVLAGGIAHDFNNILNIIQGYASVLGADGSRSKQTEESVTVINESIQRGSALVQQLLTLARKSSTQRESVNVNAVIEGLIALMTQTFPKTIELSTSLQADLPSLTADKNQVEQALLNLCVNARDAMPNGGKLIFKTESVDGASLQEWNGTPEERYLCIEVSDTGLGMDEHVRERIFEPFFTTKDKSQGTGLGLSVVYGIVKNHNGIVHVESKPDCGTTFRLYFPVSPADARPITEVITPMSPETPKEPSRWGTILLVEDEKDMLYLLEKTLLRHGYQVLTATDGEKALEVYQRHNGTIDAVLLDIGLPKIAGQEVLRRLQEQNPAVRVVIASGYLEPALKSEISEIGVQHFVDKPYRLNQVVNTLQSLIEPKSNPLT
ncbi:MAG TPA: ATP-binding protein, partial [Candidatus Binatia bacterium]|nr:ATP-binding protein [Candidatus Binatia bacterium]